MHNKTLLWTHALAIVLALLVVALGAYTRLTDAGLGCPDWPGCYGRMVVPHTNASIQSAQTQYPQIPLESRKAWTEMVHRYAAGALALLIFFLGLSTLRRQGPSTIVFGLMLLVIFQALLGMWTVTLRLLPLVVMGHLLGGMLIFALLCRLFLQLHAKTVTSAPRWRPWICMGVILVLTQIALGGWVSSNYAGIACIGFPMCNGVWVPDLYFAKGFNLLAWPGANYQGGILDNDVRVTIQFVHRIGAVVIALYIITLSTVLLIKARERQLRLAALILLGLVCLQFILGVLNVLYLLPIHLAVAHNVVAALLLATGVSMLYFSQRRPPHVP